MVKYGKFSYGYLMKVKEFFEKYLSYLMRLREEHKNQNAVIQVGQDTYVLARMEAKKYLYSELEPEEDEPTKTESVASERFSIAVIGSTEATD